MRDSDRGKKQVPGILRLICAATAMIFAGLLISACTDDIKDRDRIRNINFTPDGKRLIFGRTRGEQSYRTSVHVFDIETGELSAYRSPPDERWTMAKYSDDGKRIVLSIYPVKEGRLVLQGMQIAIMAPDGSNVKKITNTEGAKIYPSFSHSGDKVLFVKAGAIREKGARTPAADFDIYEVEIGTGRETRLTWVESFMMFPPSYLPGDDRIVFGAFGPPDMRHNNNKDVADYIYVMEKGEKTLPKPILFNSSDYKNPLINYKEGPFRSGARDPVVSRNGEIYFSVCTLKHGERGGEGDQFYRYCKDGEHERVSYIVPPSSIYSAALSPDGKTLAVVTGGPSFNHIILCDMQKATSRVISLPEKPSHIINDGP